MSEAKFREVINNNLPKLSKLTKLSILLLDECTSKNILTSSDRTELESKRQNGDYEMNSHFYREILPKKDLEKFNLFVGVMRNEKQSTEVLEILDPALDSTEIEGSGRTVSKRARFSIESPSSCSNYAPIWFDVPEKITHFTGREGAMDQLHTEMVNQNDRGENGATVITTVSGLGGIGKTAFSIHYAWEYYDKFYTNVVWINSETESDISESLGRLCPKVSATYPESKEPRATMQALYDSNQFKSSRSLFIFDNVDTFSDVKPYLPKRIPNKRNPYILITSRSQEWLENTNKFNLDLLSENECVQYFKNYLLLESDAELKCAREISDYLLCLPLAIRQAGAYIKAESQHVRSTHEVMEEYILLLNTDPRRVLGFDYSKHTSDIYKLTVYTTWTITIKKIESEVGPLVVKLMQVISLLSPTQIPIGLLEKIPGSNISDIQKCIGCLLKYSMLSEDKSNGFISIHRLVQQVIQTEIESQAESTVLNETTSLVILELKKNKFDQHQQICLIHAQHLALYIWRTNLTEKYKPFIDYLDSTKELTVGHYSKIIEILLQKKKYEEVLTEFVLRLDKFRGIPHKYKRNMCDLSSELHLQYASRLINGVVGRFGIPSMTRNTEIKLYNFSMQFIENLSEKLGEEISQIADLAKLCFRVARAACSIFRRKTDIEIDKLFCQASNNACLKYILNLPVTYVPNIEKLCGEIVTNLLNLQKYNSIIGLLRNFLDMTILTPTSHSEIFIIYIAESVLHQLKYKRFLVAELTELITETHATILQIFRGSDKYSPISLYVANLIVCCLITLRKDNEINDFTTSLLSTAGDISFGYFRALKVSELLLSYAADHFVIKHSKVKNFIINLGLHSYKIMLKENPGDGILKLRLKTLHQFVNCLGELARVDEFNFLVQQLGNEFDKSEFETRKIHVVRMVDRLVISTSGFAGIKSSIGIKCSVFNNNLNAWIHSDLVSYADSSRILVYICSYLTRGCNSTNTFVCVKNLIMKLNQKLNFATWHVEILKLPETLFRISEHPAQISESLTLQYFALSIYKIVLFTFEYGYTGNKNASIIRSLYKSVLGLDVYGTFYIHLLKPNFIQQILNVLSPFCLTSVGVKFRFDSGCVRNDLVDILLLMCNIDSSNTQSSQLKIDNILNILSGDFNNDSSLFYIMVAHGKKYQNLHMLQNAFNYKMTILKSLNIFSYFILKAYCARATAIVYCLAKLNKTEETLSFIEILRISIQKVLQKEHRLMSGYLECLPVIDALLESATLFSTNKDKVVIQVVALTRVMYSFQKRSKLYDDMQYTVERIVTGLAELGELKQIAQICKDYQSTLIRNCGKYHDITVRGIYALATRLFTLGRSKRNADLIKESERVCKKWVQIAEENIGSDNWMVLWMRFVITESDEIRLTISNHIYKVAEKNYHHRECLLALRRVAIVLKDCGYTEKALQYLEFVVEKQKDNGWYSSLEICDTDLIVSLRAVRDLQNEIGMRSEALDTHRYAQALINMNYPDTFESEYDFSPRHSFNHDYYTLEESKDDFSLRHPLNYDSGPKLWLHDDFDQDIS